MNIYEVMYIGSMKTIAEYLRDYRARQKAAGRVPFQIYIDRRSREALNSTARRRGVTAKKLVEITIMELIAEDARRKTAEV